MPPSSPWDQLNARLVRVETAQELMAKDFAEALKDQAEELRYIRRTALGTAISILSAVLLAVLGLIFSGLVKG